MKVTTDKVKWLDGGFLPIYFCFCPSEKAWDREMKRLKIKDEPYPTTNGRCTTFFNLEGDVHDCIFVTIDSGIAKKFSRVQIEGVIIHEAVHVYQEALKSMGEEKPGIEMEAYSIQGIAMQLLNAYEEIIGYE